MNTVQKALKTLNGKHATDVLCMFVCVHVNEYDGNVDLHKFYIR